MQCLEENRPWTRNEVMVEESSKEVDQGTSHLTMGWGGPEARKLKLGPAGYKQEKMDGGEGEAQPGLQICLLVGQPSGQETGPSWTFLDIIIILTLVTKQFVMYLLCTEYKTDITDVVLKNQ